MYWIVKLLFLSMAWEQQNPNTSHQWAFGTKALQLMQHVYLNNELPKEIQKTQTM